VTGGSEEATGTPRPDPGAAGDQLDGRTGADTPDDSIATDFVSTVGGIRFAHASEAEMARILDFYDVRWDYEPTTFPILWNTDGDVIESFAPDFYLPDLEMYLEMTTLKQRLVRKKNRKLRRLRELYPDIRIKLFYARDFRAMMLKYGRYALFEAISGTPGQVVPDRPAIAVPAASAPETPARPQADSAAEAATEPGIEAPVAGGSTFEPVGAVANPRSRSARRRRRRRAAMLAGAEQESGT
jgi:hypothetical protein